MSGAQNFEPGQQMRPVDTDTVNPADHMLQTGYNASEDGMHSTLAQLNGHQQAQNATGNLQNWLNNVHDDAGPPPHSHPEDPGFLDFDATANDVLGTSFCSCDLSVNGTHHAGCVYDGMANFDDL